MPNLIEARAGSMEQEIAAETSMTLDPQDWAGLRRQGHHMLDDMLDYLQNIRERPVWQPISAKVRAARVSAAPRRPTSLAAVHEEFMQDVLPFAAGNVHPGFMGWVHGGGTPVGMLADMLAAGLNANLGGRDQTPIEVEREVVQWMREIFGFPEHATGLFVAGTSMANLLAVVIARDAALGKAVRRGGVAMQPKRLAAYASTAVHGCIAKAMDITGLGSEALRLVATDDRQRINLGALEEAIGNDRDAGYVPFFVVGTAGTVNTGAIDDLAGMADLCEREKLWFHVDGAYGALARLAPDLALRLHGIERADSLAFDFHKWGQVPYDAGFILVRDGEAHQNAFASSAAYLKRAERGLAAGSPWPCDFGPDLSRGFRALKTWFTLKAYGTEALGRVISHTCELARYLESRIAETPELELMAPVELNIVCFRYRAAERTHVYEDHMNTEIVIKLQESGIVAPSATTIAGRVAIRAAIVNHRTDRVEIDALVDGVLLLGRACQAPSDGRKKAAIIQVNYANSLRKNGELKKAADHFQLALETDQDSWQAHLGMSAVLEQQGDAERASVHRKAAFRGRCVVPLPYRGEQAPITVLELIAIGPGNTRFTNFLSDRVFKKYLVAAEFFETMTALPPHQLVINAIGDAESAGPALRGARALLLHTTAPVINAPEAVLATGRCEIAHRLAGLPGVITAKTLTLARELLAAPDASAILSGYGIGFPLLLRAPGFHQGEYFVRVESCDELGAALASLPGRDLIVMQYLDARGRDGKSRKYRVMMIDGQLYPLHAAISSHWKIHYFSAEMADSPGHRAEDAEFLQNMNGVLGARAMAALEAIQDTLRLDYGGIDFGLNGMGDVLVFEANATMAVIPPAEDERWDYRRPAVAQICGAVNTMLRKRSSMSYG